MTKLKREDRVHVSLAEIMIAPETATAAAPGSEDAKSPTPRKRASEDDEAEETVAKKPKTIQEQVLSPAGIPSWLEVAMQDFTGFRTTIQDLKDQIANHKTEMAELNQARDMDNTELASLRQHSNKTEEELGILRPRVKQLEEQKAIAETRNQLQQRVIEQRNASDKQQNELIASLEKAKTALKDDNIALQREVANLRNSRRDEDEKILYLEDELRKVNHALDYQEAHSQGLKDELAVLYASLGKVQDAFFEASKCVKDTQRYRNTKRTKINRRDLEQDGRNLIEDFTVENAQQSRELVRTARR